MPTFYHESLKVVMRYRVSAEFPLPAPPAAAVIAWLDAQPVDTLYISAITRAEIELGLALLPEGRRRQQIIAAVQTMFAPFAERCLVFDEAAAVHYGQIVAGRLRQGRPITVEDAQIAAIALARGLRLATRNTTDFAAIPMLAVLNPWQLTP